MVISLKKDPVIRFDLQTQIYRPLKQVFKFVVTPENNFEWQYGTLASAQISKGEISIGTLFRTVWHFMGRRIETLYEVTEFEVNKRYGFTSLSGPVDSRALYTFEMTKGGTRIHLSTETNPGDLFKTEGLMVQKFKKQYQENLVLLKSVMEAHGIVSR